MIQEQEQRRVYYDKDLKIEAYNLSGVVQKFPNHFHEYYVIGFVEGGKRHLWSRNKEYDVSAGDLILFNPRDNHYCAPIDGEPLDYRAVNIDPSVMEQAVREITGREFTPRFTRNVVYRSDITQSVSALYGGHNCGGPQGLKKKKPCSFFWSRCSRNMPPHLRKRIYPGPMTGSKTCAPTWRTIFQKI